MEKGSELGLSERIGTGWGSGLVWGWGDCRGEAGPGREQRAGGAGPSWAPRSQHPTLGSGGLRGHGHAGISQGQCLALGRGRRWGGQVPISLLGKEVLIRCLNSA